MRQLADAMDAENKVLDMFALNADLVDHKEVK